MKCPYCEGQLDSHDAACPLHPDKIEQNDLRMLYESNSGFALHVRQVRALERIAAGGTHRRYTAQCSRGSYQIGEGREVLVLVSAYSVEDAVRQLWIPQTFEPRGPIYRIKAICPWDPRLHGPWFDARSGVWEQDEKKIPGQPVTP